MEISASKQCKARMFTHHGVKKNQGKWAFVNNCLALTYTEGKPEKVVGYTTVEEMMTLAQSADLPRYELDF